MRRSSKPSLEKIKKKILETTVGLAENLTDGFLFIISGLTYFLRPSASYSLGRAMEDIGIILEGCDPEKLRQNLYNLRQRGYLSKDCQLTKQGWSKIKSLTPTYQKPQHWDGQWYLVVFDIPERLRKKRDNLRSKLMDLGFGMLQKSIWLSPHSYLEVIEKLVDYYKINDYVLTTTTSNISNQADSVLAERVWHLAKIDELYKDFITKHQKAKKLDISAKFLYLSILKQDPQLPLELLLDDWAGEKAARIAKRLEWI